MTKDMPPSSEEQISLLLADGAVSKMLRRIKSNFEEVRKRQKLLFELKRTISQESPFRVLALVKGMRELMENTDLAGKSCALDPFLRNELDNVWASAEKAAKQVLLRYPNELEKACSIAELPLDESSRHPRYTFDKGFFELEVDYTGIANLSDSERKCGEFSADIATVIKEVKKHHDRVFNRAFDGEDFLRRLRSEYLNVLHEEGLTDGTSISLRRIAKNMTAPTESVKDGTRVIRRPKGRQIDEFVVDVSRLINTGIFEINGRRLELLQTDDRKQGILLHDVPISWYVGSVRFKEVRP